jgi:hypothetical protein
VGNGILKSFAIAIMGVTWWDGHQVSFFNVFSNVEHTFPFVGKHKKFRPEVRRFCIFVFEPLLTMIQERAGVGAEGTFIFH